MLTNNFIFKNIYLFLFIWKRERVLAREWQTGRQKQRSFTLQVLLTVRNGPGEPSSPTQMTKTQLLEPLLPSGSELAGSSSQEQSWGSNPGTVI